MLNASQGALEGDALWYRSTAVRFKNDLDVKEIVNLWAGGSAAVKSMLAGTEMNARKLATICALLAALSKLIGCDSSPIPDPPFHKQAMRPQECRHLQHQPPREPPLSPERRQ